MEEITMVKVQIHETTFDGKPIPESGKIFYGESAGEIIELMRFQSPFTADMTNAQYMNEIFSKVAPEKQAAIADESDFLRKLAEKGFISFLPNQEVNSGPIQEVTPCADKQV
jgi:hypothetical protein